MQSITQNKFSSTTNKIILISLKWSRVELHVLVVDKIYTFLHNLISSGQYLYTFSQNSHE